MSLDHNERLEKCFIDCDDFYGINYHRFLYFTNISKHILFDLLSDNECDSFNPLDVLKSQLNKEGVKTGDIFYKKSFFEILILSDDLSVFYKRLNKKSNCINKYVPVHIIYKKRSASNSDYVFKILVKVDYIFDYILNNKKYLANKIAKNILPRYFCCYGEDLYIRPSEWSGVGNPKFSYNFNSIPLIEIDYVQEDINEGNKNYFSNKRFEFNKKVNKYINDGFIYLIKYCDDYKNQKIKIGYSKEPKKRIKSMQTSIPYDLDVIVSIPVSDRRAEKLLHNTFKEKNIRGEWFNLTKNDIYDIKIFLEMKKLHHFNKLDFIKGDIYKCFYKTFEL